jgi:hypothetical protein
MAYEQSSKVENIVSLHEFWKPHHQVHHANILDVKGAIGGIEDSKHFETLIVDYFERNFSKTKHFDMMTDDRYVRSSDFVKITLMKQSLLRDHKPSAASFDIHEA